MTILDVKRAVIDLLKAGAGWPASIGSPPRLYDGAPASVALPYGSVLAMEAKPLDGDATPTMAVRFELSFFSRAPSRDEAETLAGTARELLQDAVLPMQAGNAFVLFEGASSDLLKDRKTFRTRLRFKAVGP
ncbi:DUF3168 domain-containing protein [Pseudovibrio flavus]|uniref:DUF3168 domain-containing protein n=1 Tax=Pseudovibrio flavus TaxID=2529854 RepID=UPI003529693D